MAYPTPIAYQYAADRFCPACAAEDFGTNEYGLVEGVDFEGNAVSALYGWDEWYDSEWAEPQVLACGKCHGVIDEWAPTR